MRVHHGNTCFASHEMVMMILVIMRKHKVKSISLTSANIVATNVRVINELKINAVPIMPHLVALDTQPLAFPTMNRIAHHLHGVDITFHVVVQDVDVRAILQHDAKLVGTQPIIFKGDMFSILHMNSTIFTQR